jgi:hypothetical protein
MVNVKMKQYIFYKISLKNNPEYTENLKDVYIRERE